MMDRVLKMYPKEKVGWYHFGHPDREPVLSTDCRGGSGSRNATKIAAASKFIKNLGLLYRELSVAWASINFPLWRDCMVMMDRVWRWDPSSSNIKSCGLDAWHGCAILSNVDTHAYQDLSDHKCGLAVMSVFGRCTGWSLSFHH
jgi:hypothetical protein